MKHTFELIYELDCTVGEAVAAYLDAEHYAFLHDKYEPEYKALWQQDQRIAIEQAWQKGPFKIGNSCITEYIPPARFLNYDIKPIPAWLPSIHHLVRTKTDLRYYPSEDKQRTVSHLTVELDLPWFAWWLRAFIEKQMKKLKIAKDQEDIDMIARHQKVFGRGQLNDYFRKDVFMLHKDAFVQAFRDSSAVVGGKPGNG